MQSPLTSWSSESKYYAWSGVRGSWSLILPGSIRFPGVGSLSLNGELRSLLTGGAKRSVFFP